MCILQDGTERQFSIGEEGRVEIGMHTGSREFLTCNQCTHAGSDTDTEREMQNFIYITDQCLCFVYSTCNTSICIHTCIYMCVYKQINQQITFSQAHKHRCMLGRGLSGLTLIISLNVNNLSVEGRGDLWYTKFRCLVSPRTAEKPTGKSCVCVSECV